MGNTSMLGNNTLI